MMKKAVIKVFGLLKQLWIRFGEILGSVFGTILLSLIYIVIIGPLKLLAILARKDFLGQNKGAGSYWSSASKENLDSLEKLELPF